MFFSLNSLVPGIQIFRQHLLDCNKDGGRMIPTPAWYSSQWRDYFCLTSHVCAYNQQCVTCWEVKDLPARINGTKRSTVYSSTCSQVLPVRRPGSGYSVPSTAFLHCIIYEVRRETRENVYVSDPITVYTRSIGKYRMHYHDTVAYKWRYVLVYEICIFIQLNNSIHVIFLSSI